MASPNVHVVANLTVLALLCAGGGFLVFSMTAVAFGWRLAAFLAMVLLVLIFGHRWVPRVIGPILDSLLPDEDSRNG